MSKQAVSLGLEILESKKLLSISANDPNVNKQWGLNSISSNQAWQYSTGSKSVVVAIIDSGIDLSHSDLKNNLWTNPGEIPGDNIDNDGNGYADDIHGWNFVNDNNNIQDNYGHGTHIAGIVGAEGNNGLGVAGINWGVSLMALKFMDDNGVGNTGGAIKAMEYIGMMKNVYGVNVVVANASWGGGTGYSTMLYNEIEKLNSSGIILTVAAGNSANDNDISLRYPSCYTNNNIISVAALDYDELSLASYSNYGAKNVDIAAPGSMIFSTIRGNNYDYMSGTSMASPQVAGAVALLKSIKPSLSIQEIKNAIFSSVDKIPELFGKVASNGRLNLGGAVAKVLEINYPVNNVPVGAITSCGLRILSGWVRDPNNPNVSVNVKLVIDGKDSFVSSSKSDESFVFSLGDLLIGNHNITIKAQDLQNKLWYDVAKTSVSIPAPIVRVGFISLDRIVGWAFSARSGASPVVVRVVINGNIVTKQIADNYRPALLPVFGSAYHGFNMALNRSWFRKGSNSIQIQVYDPISKQVSVCYSRTINK